MEAEGIHGLRLLMVDDLISSGATVRRINERVQKIDCKLVGAALYNTSYYDVPRMRDYDDHLGNPRKIEIWFSFSSYSLRPNPVTQDEAIAYMEGTASHPLADREFYWADNASNMRALNGVTPDWWKAVIEDSGLKEKVMAKP